MAQTISHEATAQVKDEQSKAALVTLLNRTYDQINDLQGQLDALTERIDPAPAPLPDTVNPYRLRNLPPLYARRVDVDKASENLWRAVIELKDAARRLKKEIPAASNVEAWAVAMDEMESVLDSLCQSVQHGADAVVQHALLMAQLLVLAANGEVVLPEGMEEDGNV